MQVFTINQVVVGFGSSSLSSATVASSNAASVDYTVPDNTPVGVGWTVTLDANGNPTFAEATSYPLLSPMTLYMAFTPAERIAIKASKDPIVSEFWATYQLSVQLNSQIDPNLSSVQETLAYLAVSTTGTTALGTAGPGILASTARIAEICAGVPQ